MERTHSRESGFVLCPTPAIDPRRPERRPQMESGRSRFGPARDAHAVRAVIYLLKTRHPRLGYRRQTEAGVMTLSQTSTEPGLPALHGASTPAAATARRFRRYREPGGGWPLRPAPVRRVPPLGPSAGQPGTDGMCQRHGVRHGREDSAPSFTSQGRKAGPEVGCARPPRQRCRRCS